MRTDALDYFLPPELIATEPAAPRDAARLMVIRRATGQVEHRRVRDLPDLAGGPGPGDLLIFNESKVLPAHFLAIRLATGGQVRGLYLESPAHHRWRVLLESRGRLRPGERIGLTETDHLVLLEPLGGGAWLADLHGPTPTLDLLSRIGSPPLPPYIRKARKTLGLPEIEPGDRERYNTIFARRPGSVAAPTAGLHFTPPLLAALDHRRVERAAVTLHVGLGTFAPVRTERIEDHPIHDEWIEVPPATLRALHAVRPRGGRIFVVGTTSVRALESLPDPLPELPESSSVQPYTTRTRLFITPPELGRPAFPFRFTDVLLTNFHLPRSTLLALVAALPGVGLDRLLTWYRLAVEERYRFYSYGDAMLLM